MRRRAADIRALGSDALPAVQRSEARATLRFSRGADTRARVEAIVAAESSCCAFLDFDLSDTGDALELTLEAPPGGEPALHMLADMFAAGR
jgi:hypothetical protein